MIWSKLTEEERKRYIDSLQGAYMQCLHDECKECHGTGKKQDETQCIHYISCNCPKCSLKL